MIFQAYQMPHKDNKVLFGFSIHVRCLQNKPHFTFHLIGTTDDFHSINGSGNFKNNDRNI